MRVYAGMNMGKERRGCIVEKNGRLYVRISYNDQLGKRRELMRRAKDKKHDRELKKQLVKQLDSAEGNPRAELDAQILRRAHSSSKAPGHVVQSRKSKKPGA